jgi:4-hydroxybenzoate polyprenyltransferase
MHIWEAARGAILVNPSRGMLQVAEKRFKVIKVFPRERSRWLLWVKALRIHQWSKNLLVFAPLIAAHRYFHAPQLFDCWLGFAVYCIIASSVYLLNDLLDLEADRAHPTKARRPLASGMLPIPQAVALIPVLLVAGFSLATLLPQSFLLVLDVYYVTTLAYSYWLKRVPIVDVLVLAGLYIIRVVGGAVAVNVPLSFWMMAFALFFFFSLGLAKRFTELKHLRRGNDEQLKGRQYVASDLEQIASLGAASGYVSILVLALYLNSTEVLALYSRPQVIWGACPIALYWISRVWLLAHRGQLHDDPVVFAIKDPASYAILFLAACLLIAAGPK